MQLIASLLAGRGLRQLPAKVRHEDDFLFVLPKAVPKLVILNRTAREVYELCAAGSIDKLLTAIVTRYPKQPRAQLIHDVLLTLRDLERAHLIELGPAKNFNSSQANIRA